MTEAPARRPADAPFASADAAILGLLSHLQQRDYHFITPNRSAHAVVGVRREASADDVLRDVFGWVRPVAPGVLPPTLELSLVEAGLLVVSGAGLISRVRVSSVGDVLFVHSTPDAGRNAVFLGPDSYRYARFLRQSLVDLSPARRALDIGVGAGAGALTLLAHGLASEVTGADINPEALRYARLNAHHAGLPLTTTLGPGVPGDSGLYDLIVANPPFIAGSSGTTYKDGGDRYGAALALEWSQASLGRLTPGGRFILYTGAPIVNGVDMVHAALAEQASCAGIALTYEEIDPDIFGGLLRSEAYRDVERIAAVGAVMTAR